MNEFKKRNLGLVILLYTVTGGVYGIYWTARNAYSVNVREAGLPAAGLASALLGVFAVFITLVILAMASVINYEPSGSPPPNFKLFFFAAAVAVILVYILAAAISTRIARAIRLHPPRHCSPSIAVFLTVIGFTSVIYLQYHVNQSR